MPTEACTCQAVKSRLEENQMPVAESRASRNMYIQGWRIVGKSARVTAFTKQDYSKADQNYSLTAGRMRGRPGVIFTIEIQRNTTYCSPCILKYLKCSPPGFGWSIAVIHIILHVPCKEASALQHPIGSCSSHMISHVIHITTQ